MRAWHVESPGPVTGHPLRLHPDDEPPRPGPGELLLRVLACGVCRTDLHVTEGDLPPHEPGVTPGGTRSSARSPPWARVRKPPDSPKVTARAPPGSA